MEVWLTLWWRSDALFFEDGGEASAVDIESWELGLSADGSRTCCKREVTVNK